MRVLIMKKVVLVAIMFMMFMGVVSASSINGDFEGSPIVKLLHDGNLIKSDDVPAIIYKGRTMVPISMLKKIGVDVNWDPKKYSVNIGLPVDQSSKTPKEILNDLAYKYGKHGNGYAQTIQYSNLNGEFDQIIFNIGFALSDPSKSKEYNEMIQDAVEFGADQIKIVEPDWTTFIFIDDIKDFWNNVITKEELVKKSQVYKNEYKSVPTR